MKEMLCTVERIVVNEKDWIDVLSALLTPVIAVLGCWIAYAQWKTAEQKEKINGLKNLLNFLIAVVSFQSESIDNTRYLSFLNKGGM